MNKRTTINPKRQLRDVLNLPLQAERDALAARANYGGNPVHKRNPGDFNLIPPSAPRQNKTLCDGANIFKRADALALLRQGIQRGLISKQERNGWPQNVWAVTEKGDALEGQLDNAETGSYHGYPRLRGEPSWKQGLRLAQHARIVWALPSGQIKDEILSDILHIDASVFQTTQKSQQPMGLAVRNGDSGRLQFHFRKGHHNARRFEGTRFLADYLTASLTDRWLPSTDTKTARQQLQGAFAAEFLCPISELITFLRGDISDDAIEEASQHFDVSTYIISNHLINNSKHLKNSNIVVGSRGF